jgi:hypothetical protein
MAATVHIPLGAKNSGRQCHFQIWVDCHKLKKKKPARLSPCQQSVKKN